MTGLYTCVADNEAGIDKYDVLLVVVSCDHQSSGVTYHTQGNIRYGMSYLTYIRTV